jgi:hypothetical protein
MKANILNRSALATALGFVLALPTVSGMDYNTAHGVRSAEAHGSVGGAKAAACTPATSTTEIAYNNVRTLLTTSGLLWYDKPNNKAAYEVPKTPDRTGPKAIYAGGLWMGGLSPDNQLKIAAVRYREGNDFWPGPLTVGGDAAVTSDVCERYDNFYMTYKVDAERHRAYYACLASPEDCDVADEFPDGYVIPSSYYDWPAINTEPGYDTYLAPFTDVNQDGDYDPTAGDYPGYDLEQVVDCENRFRQDPIPLFGDQNFWWVVNDKGAQHTETGGQPIGMEIRSQAFAFSTNDQVNNMTFYNYVLINRGTQTLTNTYFGQYADPDLGGSDDDFTGCDVQRGLGYVYNADEFDEDRQGSPGYGAQPPAIGIDFFEGPYQDEDGQDNPLVVPGGIDCSEAVTLDGIAYEGIGIGYGDGTPDNERFGMRAFIYYNREGPSAVTDPTLAVHYYNYLRSIWKDGTPQTYGGTGYQPSNPNAVRCYYMFPGDSDPLGWGTDCVAQTPWQESALTNPDRRFVQSAGPFTLEPGDYNNITVGVVYARASSGGAFASVRELRKADDKAQALFDNCFRILDGPDAPNIDIQELDRALVIYLTNPNGSNNVNEAYGTNPRNSQDPTIPKYTVNTVIQQTVVADPDNPDLVAPLDTGLLTTTYEVDTIVNDRTYNFQGYKVYQVRDANVSVSELDDVDLARLIGIYDIDDGVGRIVNWIQNDDIQAAVATEMVNAPDTGVVHSINVKEDLFASGDKRLVNYKTYYYITIAYSYNNYEPYNPDPDQLSGQAYPYLAGRKAASGSIRSYSGIPHPPASESGGTIQNAQYGDEFAITRIEGQGNGGLALSMAGTSEEQITAPPFRADQVKYLAGKGPVKVKVIDPLKVPNADFELWFKDTTDLPQPGGGFSNDYDELNDAYWKLVRINSDGSTDTIPAERAIEVGNEQLILDWGISVTVDQTAYDGEFSEALEGEFQYTLGADGTVTPWYLGIFDFDGETELNWIRGGTAVDTALMFEDYDGVDDDQVYEKTFGTWAPFALIGTGDFQPGSAGSSGISSLINGASIRQSSSIQVVFTPDKTKWTRCPVVEECAKPILTTPPGTKKLRMKPLPSVDKNGLHAGQDGYNGQDGDLNGTIGMGWFPGYVIELETGERLNMAFGEDSFWGGEIGKDMIWDPSSDISTGDDYAILAGGHWIYVFNNYRRMTNDATQMPHYDEGQFLQENLLGDQVAGRTKIWRACNWVGSGAVLPGTELLPVAQGLIPNELRIRLCINKPYLTYVQYAGHPDPGVNTDRNGGLGLYTFSTEGLQTVTEVNSVQEDGLDEIGVVPNPYYAFSGYETSRLDNRVKFINLPRVCTINIYNVSGTLIRAFRKDNDLTYVDWDLKNNKNVPIAGGTYIIHVEVPGAGETVLKWFGVMRPVDLQNF